MNHGIEEMINECIELQEEIALLTPVILSLSPSPSSVGMAAVGISKRSREKFKEKFERLLGVERVKAEYARQIKQLDLKLSELAERLEEEDFDIDKLRSQLSEDQFLWLLSHKKDLKKYLKGIAI